MKKLFLSLGTLVTILCTTNPSFAASHQISPAIPSVSTKVIQQSNISSSIINPEFDEYVRRRPYLRFQVSRNDLHARLLGLARRYLTLMELDKAITQILSSRR